MIATVKPRDIVGKTRRRLAVELVVELEGIDRKIKTAEKDLTELVLSRGSTLMQLTGVGPTGAARLLADVGDIRRFADRDRFASWNGSAPLDASSGDQKRHRLSASPLRDIGGESAEVETSRCLAKTRRRGRSGPFREGMAHSG